MKKFLMALMLCLVSIVSFGQLNISNSGNNANNLIAKERYNKIIGDANGYFLCVRDCYTPNMVKLFLGNTKEDAVTSLTQIYDWFESSKKKEYIEISQDGQNITIYKTQNIQFAMSYGSPDYCQEMFNAQVMSGVFGGNYGNNGSMKNELLGYCDISIIKKAIEYLNN